MTAVRKRYIGAGLMALALLVLLFAFSAAYAALLLVFLAGLSALLTLLLHRDARHISLELHTDAAGQVGKELTLTLNRKQTGRMLAVGSASVELEVKHIMFGQSQRRTIRFPLRDGDDSVQLSLTPGLCGEVQFQCISVSLWDLLGLFHTPGPQFEAVRTVVYPQPVQLELTLSQTAVGTRDTEGLMQNRPGSDPSEVYDLREYVPGDDIRSIHWKLSCKTDTLILRQPSNPSRYDVALMPDIGQYQAHTPASLPEWNGAAALTIAMGEQLLEQGTPFCFVMPTKRGLELFEVRDRRELSQLLPRWMSMEVPKQSGVGLQLFLHGQMEHHFTRLLIISAGKYTQQISSLGGRIGITAVSTDEQAAAPVHLSAGTACESVTVPAVQEKDHPYRISC